MYVYQEQNIAIDVEKIISCSQELAELYNNKADFITMKKLTDYIDGQTVDYVRSCLNPSVNNNAL